MNTRKIFKKRTPGEIFFIAKTEIYKSLSARHVTEKQLHLREKLGGGELNLLTCNCIAGICYHDLGRQFNTPVINMYVETPGFVSMLEGLPDSLHFSPEVIQSNPYPVLRVGGAILHCIHYSDPEEAVNAWCRRIRRFSDEGLHVVLTDRDGFTEELLPRIDALPFDKVLFASTQYDYEWAVYCSDFKKNDCVRDLTKFCDSKGTRFYESYFDFYEWLSGVPISDLKK